MDTAVYVLNLAKDTDRMEMMRSQLSRLSMEFQRCEGVYGLNMDDWLKPYFLDASGKIASELLPGEVGCYASHLTLLRHIADHGKNALILEDDVELPDQLPDLLRSLNSLSIDWDIIRLSTTFKRGYLPVRKLIDGFQLVKFPHLSGSTAGYVISAAGARKFLAWKTLRTLPIDQDLKRVWDCGLITYGVHPRPITPDVAGSSIDTINGKKRDYSRPVISLADEFKRVAYFVRWVGLRVWLASLFFSGSQK